MSTKGHALFMYRNAISENDFLANYFWEGLTQGDLCVLVSAHSRKDTIHMFATSGHDIEPYLKRNDLRIYNMTDTYLPNGEFVAKYMLSNVQSFVAEAKALGYKGLRTAGEMSWIEDNTEYVPEAVSYEASVNHLSEPDLKFTGLCMYRLGSDTVEIVEESLKQHPSYVYDGKVSKSPYYAGAG